MIERSGRYIVVAAVMLAHDATGGLREANA